MLGCAGPCNCGLRGLGQIETTTVTACGYGSPVIGTPTVAQMTHYLLCETESIVSRIWDMITSGAQTLGTWIYDAFQGLLDGLDWAWNKLAEPFYKIGGAVGDVLRPILDFSKQLFQDAKKLLSYLENNVQVLGVAAIGIGAFLLYGYLKKSR